MDSTEEVRGALVVASGNGTELLEPGEKVLDQMPSLVQVFILGAWDLAVGL